MKLPRGRSDADGAVLRNEAACLRVARAVGLRATAQDMGVEPQVLGQCEASIDRVATELDRVAI